MPFEPSELILNKDGSIYHLNLRPEDLAPTVLLVGDNGATANANAAGTVVVGTAGTYYLRVQDGGSGDTEYTFVVTTNGTAVPVELQSLHVE